MGRDGTEEKVRRRGENGQQAGLLAEPRPENARQSTGGQKGQTDGFATRDNESLWHEASVLYLGGDSRCQPGRWCHTRATMAL